VAHDKNIERIDLDWSEHPQKNPGLYTTVDGRLTVLDPHETDFKVCEFRVPNYEAVGGTIKPWPHAQRGFPPDYKFVLDGKRRSPYYDYECRRTPIAQQIAQELDRDFLRSGAQFYDEDLIVRVRSGTRPPEFTGHFNYDPKTGDLLRDPKRKTIDPRESVPNGPLLLWANLREPYADPSDPGIRDLSVPARNIATGPVPFDGDYVLGVDISAGSGQSCSSIAIIDVHTAEQVGEYANPHIAPHDLAILTKAMALWLNDAMVIWDGQGPTGSMFRKAFLELGYGNYWRRRAEDRTTKKVTHDLPGWIGNPKEKAAVLNAIRQSWADGTLRTYSDRAVNEASEYIWTASGAIEHSNVIGNKDPTGGKGAHGDRIMALAMAWHACPTVAFTKGKAEKVALPGSLAHRRQEAEMEEKSEDNWRVRGELVI